MKKRTAAALTCALACLAFFSSCGESKQANSAGTASKTVSSAISHKGTSLRHAAIAVKTKLTDSVRNHVKVRTALPLFSGFPGADALNRQIAQRVEGEENEAEEAAKGPSSGSSNESFYYSGVFDYTNRGGQLSVWVSWETRTGGKHASHGIDAWTVDTATGKSCGTPDFLFRDRNEGGTWLTEQIEKKIREQSSSFYSNAVGTVEKKNGNYTYYLDGDTLVVIFGCGEIAPRSAGLPSFAFPFKEMAVSAPLAVSLSGQSSRSSVRVNGRDALTRNRPASDGKGGCLLPLEDVCELLGRKVARKNGMYTVDGKTAEIRMLQGTPYAPLGFFTQTLGDFVFYSKGVLRIFPKSA